MDESSTTVYRKGGELWLLYMACDLQLAGQVRVQTQDLPAVSLRMKLFMH